MKTFILLLAVLDAETGITTEREQPAKELTQENVNEGVAKMAELKGLFEGLSDEDAVTATLKIVDEDDPEHFAIVQLSKVKKKEFTEVAAMVETAFNALNPQQQPTPVTADPVPPVQDTTVPPADDTTVPPADDTAAIPADETAVQPANELSPPPADSAPESDEQQP